MRQVACTRTLWGVKKKVLGAFVALAFVAVTATACGGSGGTAGPDTTIVDVSLVPAGTVIDVRSAEEFAEGHVQGARNLNVENGDLEAALGSLDKGASYSVYCRSGRRSAVAVEMMRNAGFTKVVDLGALDEAAESLSLPVVRN